jgi:hypothetical protein
MARPEISLILKENEWLPDTVGHAVSQDRIKELIAYIEELEAAIVGAVYPPKEITAAVAIQFWVDESDKNIKRLADQILNKAKLSAPPAE